MADNPNPPADVPPVIPPAEVPGNGGTPPGDGGAREIAAAAGMSLEQINELTGRSYRTLEDAQRGVKETYAFVGGKPRELPKPADAPAPIIPEGMVTRAEFEAANFLRDHPEHNANRQLLEQLAKANGKTLVEVATGDPEKDPVAKLYHETANKLKLADESANTRSALTSNPRLGIIRDSSSKAMEAFEGSQKARASGDVLTADRLQKTAESEALSAVIGAFKMEGDTIVD